MSASKDIYYGLDIQKEYIAVAQYSLSTHAITLVALQPIDGSGANALSEELGVLKSKFKFINPKVNCSLSVENAIVKPVPVDISEPDVEGALSWELEQNIIGTPDDYVYDFQQMKNTGEAASTYQLVAYRKERIHELTTLLKNHKLIPRCVDLDIFAITNIFEISYPELTSRPTLLIHAETADARIILTRDGSVIDYEYIRFDPDPDPQIFAHLVTEVIPRLGQTAGVSVDPAGTPCFASGMLFTRESFIEKIKSTLPAMEYLHPFRKIECRIGIDEEKLVSYIPQLVLAVGLAIRGDE